MPTPTKAERVRAQTNLNCSSGTTFLSTSILSICASHQLPTPTSALLTSSNTTRAGEPQELGRHSPGEKTPKIRRMDCLASGPLIVVVLAVFSVLLLLLPPLSVSSNSEGDALFALRKSLSDPGNVLQSWDPTLVNPCTWFHITCNHENRVTRVDLGNSNLSGHLVPELGRLEHLQYLELYKNKIQGTIPAEFGNLKGLICLDLYNNNISGIIPPTLGKLKSLVFLRLNNNQLTGRIPKELTGISSLKVVDVSGNNLCGTIPTAGPFERIPLNNFENNPRLEGPELLGLAAYDVNC